MRSVYVSATPFSPRCHLRRRFRLPLILFFDIFVITLSFQLISSASHASRQFIARLLQPMPHYAPRHADIMAFGCRH